MINDETRDAACLRNRTTCGRYPRVHARRSFVFARGRQGVRRDEESTVTSPQGPREGTFAVPSPRSDSARAFVNFLARYVALRGEREKKHALSCVNKKKERLKDIYIYISTWSYVWTTSYRRDGGR